MEISIVVLFSSLAITGLPNEVSSSLKQGSDRPDPLKHIRPGKELDEVCEGDEFLLICPENSVIKLAKNTDIQFGRNGSWENRTQCGAGDVSHCTTVNGKKLFLSPCSGKSSCLISLEEYEIDDPCPAADNQQIIRKYLTVRYSCQSIKATNKSTQVNLSKPVKIGYTNLVVKMSKQKHNITNTEDDENSNILFPNNTVMIEAVYEDIEDTVNKEEEYTTEVDTEKISNNEASEKPTISAMPTISLETIITVTDNSTEQKSSPEKESDYMEKVFKADMIKANLTNIDPLDENTKVLITDTLANVLTRAKLRSEEVDMKTYSETVLQITEKIGKDLLEMMDPNLEEAVLTVKTENMELKLVKKFLSRSNPMASTAWLTNDKEVILPDQPELCTGETDNELQVTMATHNNMASGLNSAGDIITVSVNKIVNLSKPIIFLLPNNGSQQVSCAFWSFSTELWSKDGCTTLCHNQTHTKCSCDHLTNFALIFNVHERFLDDSDFHALQLTYITYFGFTVSILCMVFTIIVFVSLRRDQRTERDVIHVNLCISLLTAELIFLFGINQTGNATLCSVIAVSLHYFFLASFAWMFLEGFQIYVLLVKVFESSGSSSVKNYIFGYIVPLIIVACSIISDFILVETSSSLEYDICQEHSARSSYGTENFCWLRVDNHFVLCFIIPAVIVIFCNIGFLTFAIYSMFFHKIKMSNESRQNIVISYMKGVGVLMCLLGSTWIFGLLYIVINSLVIAYIFTILNCLQGVGIFIFQCLLNPSIHSQLNRKISSVLMSLGVSSEISSYSLRHSQVSRTQNHGGNDLPLNSRKLCD